MYRTRVAGDVTRKKLSAVDSWIDVYSTLFFSGRRFVCLAAEFCFTTVVMIAAAVADIFFAVCSFFVVPAEVALATGVFREGDFSESAFFRLSLLGTDFLDLVDVAGSTEPAFWARLLAAFFCLTDFSILPAGSTTF